MILLIDSWAWIEYGRGTPAGELVRAYIEGDHTLLFSAINVAEVYRWFLHNKDEPGANVMHQFMMSRGFVILLDDKTAVAAAKEKVEHKMGLADAIVLATAKSQKATIITGDPDFAGHPDVIIIR